MMCGAYQGLGLIDSNSVSLPHEDPTRTSSRFNGRLPPSSVDTTVVLPVAGSSTTHDPLSGHSQRPRVRLLSDVHQQPNGVSFTDKSPQCDER